MSVKLHIKKGDMVQVIAGDNKGKQGKVLIHVSNLMVLDPKSGKPTKVGRKADAKGKLVRYAKKSGEEIK